MPRKNKETIDLKAPANRFEIITHNNVQVLVANYGLAKRDEVWALTHQIDKWLSKQKPDSARILFDVERPYYEAIHANHWKKSLGRYDLVIHKSAFCNASPFMLIIVKGMRAFATLSGTAMKKNRGVFFEDRESALDWLVQ